MHRRFFLPVAAVSAFLAGAGPARAQTPAASPREFRIAPVKGTIEVDGRLDEAAWEVAEAIPLAWEIRPGENVEPPVSTVCRTTYDATALYIGCVAEDPRPERIRAYLSDRDAAFDDDRMIFLLDPFNDRSRAFNFGVTPLGIQIDGIFNQVEGSEDFSWDAIWESAGRITDDGYVVEVGLPFKSLRFPRGAGVQTWGFIFERSWPRSSVHRFASAPRDRSETCLLCQQNRLAGFRGISPGNDIEFDPTLTARRTDRRDDFPGGNLENDVADVDVGLTARWGVTPNVTLNGTLNPDFSQVEADVAQLDVNQRFALFFPEKRPFFLEGSEFFEVPGNLVFTRTVGDPLAGMKATGKEGGHAFGAFVTRDRLNNLVFPGPRDSEETSLDGDVDGAVGRYRRDVGESSSIGAVLTSRDADGYHNRLVGTDGLLRFGRSHSLRFLAAATDTDYPDPVALAFDQAAEAFAGGGWSTAYAFDSRNWEFGVSWDDIGDDFRADFGFLPQVGFRQLEVAGERLFWGEDGDPYDQIAVGVEAEWSEDQNGFLLVRQVQLAGSYSGPLQAFVRPSLSFKSEAFAGRIFDLVEPRLSFELLPAGWVEVAMFSGFGHEIDFANARRADEVFLNPRLELRIGRQLELSIDHTFQRLSDDGEEIFTANLTELRALWHFDVRTFVRAIVQYRNTDRSPEQFVDPVDDASTRVFTQLLFSYKVNPQTVVFAGYSENRRGTHDIDLTRSDRTFFLKLGYAWRL